MNHEFNPMDPAERTAVRAMLDALDAMGVGQTVTPQQAYERLFPSKVQADAMDETGGIGRGNVMVDGLTGDTYSGLPPVPTPADAAPSSTAPVDPSAFSAPPTPVPAPPAVTASAPVAPPAPAATANHVVEGSGVPFTDTLGGPLLDTTGLPWDERIHSSGENRKNKDGTWRQRRNLNKAVLDQVEAELRGSTATPGAQPVPAPPLPSPMPINPPPSPELTAIASANGLKLPAAPVAPPVPLPPATPSNTPPAAAPVAAPATWIDLVQYVSANSGVLDEAEVRAICTKHGHEGGLMFMAQAPAEVIAAVAADMAKLIEGGV